MNVVMRGCVSLLLVGLVALSAQAQPDAVPYERTVDHVYGSAKGEPLYMDIFVPNGENKLDHWQPNENGKGLAIIDIASGGWSSDRGKIKDHEDAQVYNIFCARDYTVFAIRPGSRGEYTVFEMVDNIKAAIRYVKEHASKYDIDPERIGLMGASAGGHLASLTVLTEEPGDANAEAPLLRHDTSVKAVAMFFPPTDFLDWEGRDLNDVMEFVGDILFIDGVAGKSEDEIRTVAEAASPRRLVRSKTIPFNIMHGDADTVVPLQQSEVFVKALEEAGTEVDFFIKPGGTHPWITIPLEVIKMADWFDEQLRR